MNVWSGGLKGLFYTEKSHFGFLMLFVVFSFFSSLLFSHSTYASSSITLITDESVVLNMPAGGGPAIASSNINVITTCRAGYNLTMNATSTDNHLYLDGDPAYRTQSDAYISPSDGVTPLKNATNTWGYSMASPAPTEDSIFLPVPDALSPPAILKTPAGTASETDIDDHFSIYFGVSVSPTIVQGSYSMPSSDTSQTGFSYLATVDPSCDVADLEVTFDANAGSDPVSDLPSSSDVVISDDVATLPSNIPTRTGYTFIEWNTSADGTGTTFYPGGTISIGTGPGQYSGTLPLYAIWVADCPTATVCYNGNHADAGTMNNQTIVDNATIALIPSNFSRAGYGFVGWSTNPRATVGGSDTIYGPNQNFTVPSSGPGVNLYAIWLAPVGDLQTWANPNSLNVGDVIALKDNRDDEVYAVAKLADNNIWIIENLRLIPDSNVEITTRNTNSPTSDFLSKYPSSSPSGMCSNDNATCDDSVQYNTNNINRGLTPSYNTNDNASSWYSYGVMYNWYTATAGNGLYSRSSGSVSGDLCPAGWHLPTGGSGGEWGALNTAVNNGVTNRDIGLRAYPVNIIRSGDYNPKEGGGTGRGTQGRMWSATAASGVNAYRMGYSASDASATNKSWNKWDGFAVRCIYQGGNIHYVDVDVVFSGTGIESLTFTNPSQPTETATPSDPSIPLAENTLYAVTATTSTGYEVYSWASTSGGILGDSVTVDPAINPNTYTLTDDATLTITGQQIPSYTVTATIPEHVTSISFTDPTTSPATVITIDPTSPDCTDNGDNTYTCEVDLKRGIEYTISATYEEGYTLNTWTTGAGGTLGDPTSPTTTFAITSATTLSLSAKEAEELTYTLSYDAGSGTDAPDSETKTSFHASETFTITNSAPIYYGYTFLGWSEAPGATTPSYVSGDTYTITSTGVTTTKTLYAVYQANSCPANKICYYDNGADVTNGGRGTMNNQSTSSSTSANLIPSNYSKTGYGFAGWSTVTGDTTYGPNATITTPDTSASGLALYAKWVKSEGELQSWRGCNAMSQGDVIALTDTRDNQAYAVAKLADDNCWTIENLRLDPGTANITASNTHSPTSTFISQSQAGGGASLSTNTMCNSSDDADNCINQIQYNANSLNRSLTPSYNTASSSVGWYSYGVYYNWYTATAGNGTYSMDPNINVAGDICPSNWHLPTGNTTGEYNALNTAINNGATNTDAGWRNYPNNFVWSGDYNNDKRTSGYSNGRLWTATTKDNPTAYRIGYKSNEVTSRTNSYNKWDGFIVRCMRDESAAAYHDVTVALPQNVSSIVFVSAKYGSETATAQNPVVSLAEDTAYTITANISPGYELDEWTAGENSTIGSTTQNPTTFTITDDSTLTLSTQVIPSYTITVNMDEHVSSIGIYNADYGTQTVTTSGSTVTLYRGIEYALSSSYDNGYGIDTWSTTAGGTLGSTTDPATTYVVTGTATLSLTSEEKTLYDLVADQVKRDSNGNELTQSSQDIRQAITIPTSTDRTQDTSNSGVYKYDPSIFGTASDASNNREIYYYRGVLENSVGSYGSDGSAVTYPNYVVLSPTANSSGLTTSDTCWRIVRTTGSGGVKMVYNGLWTGTTCANTTTNAQVTDSAYNGTDSTHQRIARVGYTYNPTYGDSDVTTATSVNTVFGNNSNYSANSSNSTIKDYIENTWFSNISAYEGILEPSAGYCNDRTAYSNDTTSTALSTIVPYATSNATMYFGAYGRNMNAGSAGKTPSLTCPSNRNVVDLYTASSASNGNKQLTKPAALLTADEVSLAGSGRSTASEGSACHANSFLHSGSDFWLLSPYYRSSYGYAHEFYLRANSYLTGLNVNATRGVRPAISLISGTTAASGSGIATDPWVVNPISTRSVDASLDSHISSVTITDPNGNTQTVTSANPTASLIQGIQYTITANTATGYELASWSTTSGGTLGSTTANPTTYTVSDDTILTVTSQVKPSYTVTVNMDEHVSSIGIYNADYGTQTVTTSGSTVTLYRGIEYILSSSYNTGYDINAWSTTANGTLGSTTNPATTYVVTGAATLSLTSKVFTPTSVVTDPGYISYNPNAPVATTPDTIDDQVIQATDTSAELWPSNFQRPGYGFAGWTDKYDWVLNENDADGNGTGANAGYHIYGPNQTISFTAGQYSGDNPGLSLYAVWVPSAGDLQGYTCPNNTTMPVGTVTALTDTRDDQTYTIAKLKDNKCWMVENLRLDNQYTTGAANIAKAQGYKSNFIGLANPETANFTTSTTANSLYSTDGSTAAPTIIGADQIYRFPRYNNQNTANPASNMTAWDNNSNTYSVGNYYTWAATIADTGDYVSGTHNTTSICPSGWHIPVGGTNGEYYILNTEQNAGATNTSVGLRAYPANFIYSGEFYGSSARDRSTYGYYWSSTASGYVSSYGLGFGSSSVYPGTNSDHSNGKYIGSSIRCSLNVPSYSVTVSLDSHISSVTFTDGTNSQTATTQNPIVSLTQGIQYTVTANTDTGYELANWSTTSGGTLGSTTTNPTAYSVSSPTTLSVTSQAIPTYTVTVNMDEHANSVGFYNADYPVQQATTSGDTVTLYRGIEYILSSSYDTGYGINTWSTTASGTLGSTTNPATTYVVTGAAILSLTSKESTPVVTNPGYISYNPNAPASTTPDSMDDQSIADTDTSAELWASNFQRPGYGFAGWTDKYDWVLNENDADGNGTGVNAGYHIYGPNQTISFAAGQYSGDNPGLSLYAVWVPSQGDLQGYTCPNNTTMPVGTVTALTDTRDNQTYAIAKLKDNKCWMVENLRLDNQYTTSAADIAKAQGYNSSFIGLANPETANFTNSTTANSLYSTDGSTAAPAITVYDKGFRFPRYNNQNTANPATNMTAWDNNSNTYSVGNWYTWAATIADTSDYNGGTYNTTSICPSGWHIPTGSTSGEYDILNTEQNAGATSSSTGLRAYPANFIYSGDFSGSSAYVRGTVGYYWSSTSYNFSGSRHLRFSSSSVQPGTDYSTKNGGLSIRCTL